MSPEERQLLEGLFQRIGATANQPRDREAEAFLADGVRAMPYAPYVLAQTVIVQEQALRAANDRLQQLETQVRDLQERAAPRGAAPQSGGFLGGLGSLFGGQSQQPPPRQSPWGSGAAPQGGSPWAGQQPPQQAAAQPGGFLKGALGAAAGVAGGVLMADAIRGLFHGPGAGAGGLGGLGIDAGFNPPQETVINNYYGDGGQSDMRQASDSSYDNSDDGGYSDASDFDDGDPGADDTYEA
ncbi:MAG: DUF2076 domain-containing protein [Hyphomicrobiales bacterium]|nr:DUF2076 domain-containing protein [Hyphomicrobiales bacterium]